MQLVLQIDSCCLSLLQPQHASSDTGGACTDAEETTVQAIVASTQHIQRGVHAHVVRYRLPENRCSAARSTRVQSMAPHGCSTHCPSTTSQRQPMKALHTGAASCMDCHSMACHTSFTNSPWVSVQKRRKCTDAERELHARMTNSHTNSRTGLAPVSCQLCVGVWEACLLMCACVPHPGWPYQH